MTVRDGRLTIDTRAPLNKRQAAYPGIHRGSFSVSNTPGPMVFCRVGWQTVLLTPYASMEKGIKGPI